MSKKMFDFCIGNPPYNADFQKSGDNGKYAAPVYDKFMDVSYKIADCVELIHPARFLFNAGSTNKKWNEKMLNDPHFKVLKYEPKSDLIFPNTDIKGGVAITYYTQNKKYEAIGVFTAFSELNSIVKKAATKNEENSLSSIIYTQVRFDLESLYADYPSLINVIGSNGKDKRFRNNAFSKIPVFLENKTNNDDIKVIGILRNKRVWRYINKKYVDTSHENLQKWKVLVPRANGSGSLGEVLSTPLIGEPLIGYTQSFIGIGAYDEKNKAEAVMKYIKTKFARVLLGVLKVTQDNDRGVWKLIPLQDFTDHSDIDWSKSIPEIDQQLYRKYGLNEEEIDFIETHVKEMK